jgi:hypothetical protein
MGQLDVHIRHGGGGGPSLDGLVVPVVLAALATAVIEFVLSIIVWLAIIMGVVLAAALAVLIWWLRTQPARKARFDEAYRAGAARLRAADEAKVLQRQAFALELARASAPVINNIIDPAAIAAAVAGAQRQPARVLRAEVER